MGVLRLYYYYYCSALVRRVERAQLTVSRAEPSREPLRVTRTIAWRHCPSDDSSGNCNCTSNLIRSQDKEIGGTQLLCCPAPPLAASSKLSAKSINVSPIVPALM